MYFWPVVMILMLCLFGCTYAEDEATFRVPPDPPLAEPVYLQQALSPAQPSALEFWVASPVRHDNYPWNIIRMWFPEAAGIDGPDGKELWRLRMIDDPAKWEHTPSGLRAVCSIPGGGEFIRVVSRDGDAIHFVMTFRNQSGALWKNANAGSCLQLSAAPDYEDNVGDCTYWVLEGTLTPTYHMAITDAGMRTSRPVGAMIEMKDGTKKRVTEPVVFVSSRDGKYVLGYSWQPGTGLFYNRAGIVACNHVQPPSFDVPAAEERSARGVVFLHEGTLEETYQRYLDWKASPPLLEDPVPLLNESFLKACAFVCVDIQPGERTTATLESMPEAWRNAGMKPEDLNKASDHKFDIAYPNARKVADACRSIGLPMIFIHWGFSLPDGMDLEPSIRQFNVATFGPDASRWPNHVSSPGARPAGFLGVRDGEYVLAKTHHDAFASSNLSYVLENLGVKNIVFIGGHTDACLGKTSIAAKEHGYRTLCVEDATFAGLMSLWRPGLLNSRYDYIVTTEEFLRLVESAHGK